MTTNIMKRRNGIQNAPATFGGLVDQLFLNSLDRFLDDEPLFKTQGSASSVPVNIRENDKSFEMSFSAPGLKKEDFKLEIKGDLLTVSFEHQEENSNEDNQEGWLRREFRHESFSRSFTLNDSIDANKITAQYNNGILLLTLPKKEGAQRISRMIEIN